MLRISLEDLPEIVTVKLEGRIVDESVKELARAWQTISESLAKRRLCLDIRGVTFVNADGRKLLAQIYEETHNDFRTNTPLTNFLAQEAKNHRNKKIRGL